MDCMLAICVLFYYITHIFHLNAFNVESDLTVFTHWGTVIMLANPPLYALPIISPISRIQHSIIRSATGFDLLTDRYTQKR